MIYLIKYLGKDLVIKMEKLKNTIIKEYSNIRIDEGDTVLQIEELQLLLSMLDASTLGDILADIKAYRKTVV